VDVLNGSTLRRSHSCKSNSKNFISNSKVSPSQFQSNIQNSKSTESPLKGLKITSKKKEQRSPDMPYNVKSSYEKQIEAK
jgi:hypothetical protein